jgi:general secretion pathway protein H
MQPPSRYHTGFTLLELVVVLFIMVLGVSVVTIQLSSGNNAITHQRAASDIVSALRYARNKAVFAHQDSSVTFDLAENSYTVDKRDKTYQIPSSIALTVVTAKNQLRGQQASIRFFPDGSSTGGRVTLTRAEQAWQIDINWLTGQINLEKK